MSTRKTPPPSDRRPVLALLAAEGISQVGNNMTSYGCSTLTRQDRTRAVPGGPLVRVTS